MYKNKKYLAIIPARAGSKRLPEKNILDLNGKPLIYWSIKAGLKSRYIDKVVVSSQDQTILNIAKKYESNILNRPEEISNDTATTYSVIMHAIESLKNFDYIVLLQPTSPLRTYKHVDDAIELLEKVGADSVIGVCEMDHSPLWSNTLPKDGCMDGFLSEKVEGKRSQELKKYYRINGAIYILKKDKLLKDGLISTKGNVFSYLMDRSSSIDIDESIDLDMCRLIMNAEY
jgi:CMP-N,N'-diacetyllegionaminic acid synthase